MTKEHISPHRPRPIIGLAYTICMLLALLPGAARAGSSQPSIEAQTGLALFERVDGWVRDWDVPPAESPETNSEPLSAAVVTLRLDGKVFGRGSAASPDPDPTVLWQAARRAINSANSKLTNQHDAMWEAFVKQLSERITISVELGAQLVPVSPSELTLPGFGYSPGSMGLAVRLGENADALGPESIITSRADPARSAAAMALSLSNDPNLVMQSPEQLSEQGFVFYRWVPLTLAQPAPGLGGVFTDRGGRFIQPNEITLRAIETLGDDITAHLLRRRWAGVENYGFMGTLDPVSGNNESPFAAPFEQALGAYALLRYGQDAQSEHQRDAVVAARELMRALARVEPREQEPWADPVASCMTVVALSELPLEYILGDPDLGVLRTRCLETLDTLYSTEGGFVETVPRPAHGLVAHALTASAKLDPRDRAARARSAVSRVFLDTPPELLVSQMPFLAWAQFDLLGEDEEVPTRTALRQMRELVWEHQLRRADLGWIDRDLMGGIVFTRASAPLPSWSALRPLTAIAAMLGDPRLTEGGFTSGEAPMQVGRLVESIRFVRQLTAEGELMHLYSSVEQAQWGVRMALWDQRMPIEASAMALLMLSETRASFDALSDR